MRDGYGWLDGQSLFSRAMARPSACYYFINSEGTRVPGVQRSAAATGATTSGSSWLVGRPYHASTGWLGYQARRGECWRRSTRRWATTAAPNSRGRRIQKGIMILSHQTVEWPCGGLGRPRRRPLPPASSQLGRTRKKLSIGRLVIQIWVVPGCGRRRSLAGWPLVPNKRVASPPGKPLADRCRGGGDAHAKKSSTSVLRIL